MLDGFSFDLEPGSITVLLGSNGVGKSTILALLHGILRPDSGTLARATGRSALLPQRAAESLFPQFTVLRNLYLPLEVRGIPRDNWDDRVSQVLRELDLIEDLSSILGRRPFEVSGGQQQLTALARALVEDPDLLLLDEPVKELDPRHAQSLIRMLKRWVEGKVRRTLVMTSHTLEHIIPLATRVVLLAGPPVKITGDWQLGPAGHSLGLREGGVSPSEDVLQAIAAAFVTGVHAETGSR